MHGYFLLNMEATLYLLSMSLITHVVIVLLTKVMVNESKDVTKLGLVSKKLVEKREKFVWDGLPR